MRDGRGDIFGMVALDRLVMVAVDDEDRRVDRLELIVASISADRPHPADMVDERVIFLGRRGIAGIFMTGALDDIRRRSGSSRALFHAGGDGVGGEGEHLADPVLVAHREVEPKDAPVAPADDVGLRDLQRIHQRHDVVGHQFIAVRARVAGRTAMAAAVHQDHGMVGGDRGPIAPIVGVGEAAVQEDHRRTLAVDRIIDLIPLASASPLVGRDRRGRRRQGLPPLAAAAGSARNARKAERINRRIRPP